jgi:ABC-type amino acid transport substrate-binding protein
MDEQNKSTPPVTPAPDTSNVTPDPAQSQDQQIPSATPALSSLPDTPSSAPAPTNSTADPETPATPSSPAQPPSSAPTQHTKSRFPWIILLIIMFIGFLALATWYFTTQLQKTTAPSQTASSSSPTTLVVGTDPTFQPMEFTQNGKIVGYDIDLADLIAKQLGTQVKFKNITFDNLFTALQQRQIDLIISAVTITPERQKKYAFSKEYLNAGQVIITQKTNTLIKAPTDLKGKKIGVQQGTTDETEALKYTDKNLVINYPDYVQATKALVNGNIDAIITDLPSAQGIAGNNPTLKIASDPFTNDYYGIVFRKGDPEVEQVNKALDSLRVRGYLTELKHKWLE